MDRKSAHAMLWSNRLNSESHEVAMEKQITSTHQKLAEKELEIEKLKQQLKNEKQNNIQLVQWKARHLKQIDNLKKEIDELKGAGDVNITQLLQTLSDKHAELDVLREECAKFDELTEQEVRKPMKGIDGLRDRIYDVKRAKSSLLEVLLDRDDNESEVHTVDIVKLKLENARLTRRNQLLKDQIRHMESTKDKQSSDVRQFMETTIQPPPPSIRTVKAPGIIIRPMVVNRSFPRL
jgi:uncharacterized phage infection (PIP) family protein YhgE